MNRSLRPDRSIQFAALIVLAAIAAAPSTGSRYERGAEARGETEHAPSDWFFFQRAYPFDAIPQKKVDEALDQARADREAQKGAQAEAGLLWTPAGPYNIGGRIAAITAAPGGNPVYFGAAAGGIFKSTNFGVNWTPIFDLWGVYSIGSLTLDPSNSNVIYAGTGESNGAIDNYDGAGLFRSEDGGQSWTSLGLAETARIARVAVDPFDSTRIFVAAMGTQFSTGPDRGVYRSLDRGAHWSKVLFVSDSTGACDVVINPAHPETVYCATWERVRRYTYRRAFGPECGIWRSANGGDTWVKLAGGLPTPDDNLGRIGLSIPKFAPSVIFAQVTSGAIGGYSGVGVYRSLDGGVTWVRRDTGAQFVNAFGGFSWYFGDLAVDPTQPERVFCLGQDLLLSTNGGVNFSSVLGATHVDEHAMWIDPVDSDRIYLGNDGGFYYSTNGGTVWTQSLDTPITQFYAGTVDPSNSSRLMGGAQDNSTSITSGSPNAWGIILGGDGFQCLISPANPNIVYAEYQNCCSGTGPRRSTNGGASFGGPTGFSSSDRYNWNSPIAMSPKNPNVLLAGSQRVYKSVNGGVNYSVVSGDLSTNPVSSLGYGTLSTLAISPADTNLYLAGTDDGRVWYSPDAGVTWNNIQAGLPVRYITRVTPDRSNRQVIYVTLSGFGQDDPLPHVFRSADLGATWASVSSNLPDAPANDLVVDPEDPGTLYLATDIGVYATHNLGAIWFPLGIGLPITSVADLSLYDTGGVKQLIAATHGRSQWRLDLAALPVAVGSSPPAASRLALEAPAPNPSRGEVRMTLELPSPTGIDAGIYDLTGRRIRALESGPLAAGRHTLNWDGRDQSGRSVPAGVYFARVESALGVRSRSIVRER